MSIERQKSLEGQMDSRVWADEFIRLNTLNPSISKDREIMTGWFSNAIITGYEHHARKMQSLSERPGS